MHRLEVMCLNIQGFFFFLSLFSGIQRCEMRNITQNGALYGEARVIMIKFIISPPFFSSEYETCLWHTTMCSSGLVSLQVLNIQQRGQHRREDTVRYLIFVLQNGSSDMEISRSKILFSSKFLWQSNPEEKSEITKTMNQKSLNGVVLQGLPDEQ